MKGRWFAASLGFVVLVSLAGSFVWQARSVSAQTDSRSRDSKHRSLEEGKGRKSEVAVFGGGCFWSIEAIFERVPGVHSVVSGFSGGTVPNPSYEMVCTGRTGHAEVVRIEFDPEIVTFEKLLTLFWRSHDPTTWNRQGDDFGPQYRSIILYVTDSQKQAVLESYQDLTDRKVFTSPIVTELHPFQDFFPAEQYHQNYFRNQRYSAYSLNYIVPKLKKLRLLK